MKGIGKTVARKCVRDFAEEMEIVLKENDYKGGWQDCTIEYLEKRLKEEITEYFMSKDNKKKELIDISNFCMMLASKYE